MHYSLYFPYEISIILFITINITKTVYLSDQLNDNGVKTTEGK